MAWWLFQNVVITATLALIVAGGLGNLYDRVFEGGAVTDFLNVGVGPLRTGIFNVADVAIVAGVLLMMLSSKAPATPTSA